MRFPKPAPTGDANPTPLGLAALVGLLLIAAPAKAQYIGAAPPPPAPLAPGAVLAPADALARYIRFLALNPRDFAALVGAGRAAQDTGDTQAAIGFFSRAQEVRPTDPAPKLGLGAASVAMDDPAGALAYFAQAQRDGANPAELGLERGLAFDLRGQQGTAQFDYRAALNGTNPDEARRRLALSLAISGQRGPALAMLQPLLGRRDPAALRAQAFVMALTGDDAGATRAIEAAMPGTGSRFAPFFRALPGLRAEEKAAAVHLGIFPSSLSGGGGQQVAAATPVPAPASVAAPIPAPAPPRRKQRPTVLAANPAPSARDVAVDRVTSDYAAPPPTIRSVGRTIIEPNPLLNKPPVIKPPLTKPRNVGRGTRTLVRTNGVTVETPITAEAPVTDDNRELARSGADQLAGAAGIEGNASAAAPATPPPVEVRPGQTAVEPMTADRLASIDELLTRVATVPRAPPPSRPRIEAARIATKPLMVRAPTAKSSSDALAPLSPKDKPANARVIKDGKGKAATIRDEPIASIGVKGSNWVQLAGGSNADRLAGQYRSIRARKAALFAGKGGYVTSGKDYFRLLVGPFADPDAAREFVNRLDKAGIDSFSWTRTPANLKIEKLPAP